MHATRALLIGFGTVMSGSETFEPFDADEAEASLADAFHVLLEPPHDPPGPAVAKAAETVLARFTQIHDNLLERIAAGADGTRLPRETARAAGRRHGKR